MLTKTFLLDHLPAPTLLDVSAFTLLAVPQSAVFLVILLIVLLLLSFITSGSEVALFTLHTRELNNLRTKQHDAARRIVTLLEERKAVYTSLLIAGTFFNISIIILANYLLTGPLESLRPAWLQWGIKIISIAFVLVLVGKILPKVWATQNNLRFAYGAAAVVEALHLVLRRISLQMVGIADNINQRSGVNERQSASMRELDEAIDVNANETTIEEKNILKGIVKFGNITVRQIMKFRMEVNGLDQSLPFADVVRRVEDLHYSRLPVYRTNLDNIVGVINTKDLLPHLREEGAYDWHTLIRPPFFVPESKLIKDLLKEFQSRRIHFAIVVDEFGGTSGIVTMEDILEEIIGDIRDEFDEEETSVKPIDDNTWIVDAKLMLHDMCRAMRLPLDTFDPVKGESDSVGGLVLEIAGAFPEIDSSVRVGDFLFTVLEISRNRITSVKVTIDRA